MVEIPVLNKLKRKRTSSPEALSPQRIQLNKKRRPEEFIQSLLPSANTSLPAKATDQQTFTQASETLLAESSLPETANMDSTESTAATLSSQYSFTTPANREAFLKPAPNPGDVPMADLQHSTSGEVTGSTQLQHVIETSSICRSS